MADQKTEKEIHKIFDLTLILKGAHAFVEIVGGIILYIISAESIMNVVRFFVQGEVFTESSKSFAALYLFVHGIINALVVIGLWKEKLWAYPLSFVVIGGFIVYQIYLLTFTYSVWLVLFTILDIIIIGLIWHEYGILKKNRKKG